MPNANEPRFPTHVAIIVDGNRRWAKQRMLPVSVGHKAGFDRLREITRYAVGDRGVFVLSLYVFSTENFSRDAKEVGYLMDLFANNFRTIADEMNERGYSAEAIVETAQREGCDLIVMVTHGRHGWSELLHGSHTKGVLTRSRLPLLVLH